MKIVTVVGARPQFIKAAPVSKELRKEHTEILIHTGQHYDENMSEIFFQELNIPKPDYNLAVGSGSHAKQTGAMLVGSEEILMKECPDYVLVYGDTNSTIAGALAASKILIPVIHVEGGVRSYNKEMPEEQNRILTDHLSSLLFCPTDTAVMNLKKEGIWKGVYQIGDVMYDAVKGYAKQLENYSFEYFFSHLQGIFNNKISRIQSWYLATIHRVENTNNIEKFGEILEAFELLDSKVIFPVHPRINTLIKRFLTTKAYSNIIFLKPLGYLDMLYFTKHAVKVITDSGGLQKEAYLLGTNVVTVRGETEWIETLADNHNVLAKASKDDILKKVLSLSLSDSTRKNVFGDGNAAKKICSILAELT